MGPASTGAPRQTSCGGARLLVARGGDAEVEVKRSRFRGYCRGAPDRAAARALLAELGQKERRATHLCWAVRAPEIAGGPETIWIEDAGEPSGTAGRPILAAIDEVGASAVLVAVARTFGGVKLGASGLKRAYHRAALESLHAAELVRREEPPVRLVLSIPYAGLGRVQRAVERAGGHASSPACAERVTLEIAVPPAALAELRQALAAIPDLAVDLP